MLRSDSSVDPHAELASPSLTRFPDAPPLRPGIPLKFPLPTALLFFALAACTSAVTREGSPADREVAYRCANGETVAVRYFPAHGIARLIRHGQSLDLQQKPSGSGFLYTNGPNTIRGKGDALTLEIGRMAPMSCTAR